MRDLLIETPSGKFKRKVPQTWDELKLPQYLKACEVFLTNWGQLGIFQENEVAVIRQSLLYIITDTDKPWWDKLKKEFIAEYGGDETFLAYLRDLLMLTDFMFKKREKEGVVTYEAYVTRTVCPYPTIYFDAAGMIRSMTIEAGKQTNKQIKREYEKTVQDIRTLFGKTKDILWYAPTDGLDNITFYEMCALFQTYERYVEKGMKDVDLCELIAILYRPSKAWSEQNVANGYEGDRRIPYRNSESTVDARKQKNRLIHPSVKKGILFWFIGCRTAIFNNPRFKPLFEGKGSDDPLKLGMFKVLFALQDSSAYNSQKAQDENALFALMYLSNKMSEANE